jgi:hypothetical protein
VNACSQTSTSVASTRHRISMERVLRKRYQPVGGGRGGRIVAPTGPI